MSDQHRILAQIDKELERQRRALVLFRKRNDNEMIQQVSRIIDCLESIRTDNDLINILVVVIELFLSERRGEITLPPETMDALRAFAMWLEGELS